jgi:hypothetical protein
MKTLALILHYNTPDMTNSLYESLSPYAGESYDLFVLDNGSEEDKKSKYNSLEIEHNGYFGGALNWAFKYVLDHEEYDSLLFLNSDLILDGSDFVNLLRDEMFENDFKLLSPSIKEKVGGKNVGCPQIQNWNTDACRQVLWFDFQCPMFHRKIIEEIGQFDKQLKLGYGQHLICGFVCEERNWKIGVTDKLVAHHLGSATMKQEGVNSEYKQSAWKQTTKYFRRYMGGKYRLKRKKYLSYAKKYSLN